MNMENKVITLRNVYGKVKEVHFQPGKQRNGMPFPFVKRVRIGADGTSEMILSDAELNNPESQYYIPEDMDIVVTDGTTFDLSNPLEYNKWKSIENSELIAPSRGAKDENGNPIIDGDKRRYGLAEFYVDIPGEESAKAVSKRKLITQACTHIEQDSVEGRLTKVKLLGKVMRHAPSSDVENYLYERAEKNPKEVIDLYTSPDVALKLLLIEAKEKHVIRKQSGVFMYGDMSLGATDESIILYLKMPSNAKILQAIKNETFPNFVKALEINPEDNLTITEPGDTTGPESKDKGKKK
jgi:hypothetical protein